MKRILATVLLLFVLMGSVPALLVGCAELPDEETVLSEFKALYERSLEINDYVFGAGLPAESYDEDEEADLKTARYITVASDAKYRTKDDFKAAILTVYSEDYYKDALENLLFSGYDASTSISARYKVSGGELQIDVNNEGKKTTGRFDLSTAYVSKITSTFVTIKADYTDPDGRKIPACAISMVKTESGWRFDAPSY